MIISRIKLASTYPLEIEHRHELQAQILVHMHHQTCLLDVESTWVEGCAFFVEHSTIESIADEDRNILNIGWPDHTFAQL